ncbi:MAG TPA: hypothetical protein VLV85_14880 [Stellaceae bacterium]|nr:hypothetical protein [Stellaceae bacterium]
MSGIRTDETGFAGVDVKLVTFETQARQDQTWRTAAIFDDRPAAVAEAERLLASRRTPAVRVVQVLYDPRNSACTEFTIFRATCFDAENERARARAADPAMFEWGEDGRARTDPGEPWIERNWPSWAPDWATTALYLSIAVLIVSVMFRWVR